jgi:hypothetical protein
MVVSVQLSQFDDHMWSWYAFQDQEVEQSIWTVICDPWGSQLPSATLVTGHY